MINKIKIKKVKPLNLAKFTAALLFFGALLPTIILSSIAFLFVVIKEGDWWFGFSLFVIGFIILVLQVIIGWISGFLFGCLFNLTSKYTGGVKIDVEKEETGPWA